MTDLGLIPIFDTLAPITGLHLEQVDAGELR